jgi:hypothetical protein
VWSFCWLDSFSSPSVRRVTLSAAGSHPGATERCGLT